MVTELRSIFIFISSTLTSILPGTYLRILPYVLVSGLEREYGSARARPSRTEASYCCISNTGEWSLQSRTLIWEEISYHLSKFG